MFLLMNRGAVVGEERVEEERVEESMDEEEKKRIGEWERLEER